MARLEAVGETDGSQRADSGNQEYKDYLLSQRWRKLRRAVMLRAKGKCEICRRWDGTECAHLTYERIFHEHLEDVLWVCKGCHRELDADVPAR